jgi:cytochrome oxidase assembly protein ShyY1
VKRSGEKHSIFKSLVAILLIAGCLWASQWQFHRGEDRKARNNTIEEHIKIPEVELTTLTSNVKLHEWRSVTATGRFDANEQILLRNRYFEGKYGYAVLTRFTTEGGDSIWVDRGWVAAGASATIAPETPPVPTGLVSIIARLRLDYSLPSGSFFALPINRDGELISKLNAQSGSSSEDYYLDLVSGSVPDLTPTAPAQIPSLSDGPHLAYAVQWILFAGLVVYGRYLIRKMDLTSGEVLPSKEL